MIKTCPICGKEFESPYELKKYCSKKCKVKSWKNNQKAKRKAAVKATAEPEFKLTKEQIAQREYLKQRLRLRRLIAQDNIERRDSYAGIESSL